ncbi:hypothetical protein HU200_044071 [Digitaria exilis]|uniref:Uncharacterized protein n=1 Tax=Digitaria exilis TaxID=1010633 RepID=A0A835B3F4_9POAL|nr:hypothetical protein HU200_044071 [Digitaria exilis]
MPAASSSSVSPSGAGGNSASTIAADMDTVSHDLTILGYSGTVGLGVGKHITSAAFAAGGHSWHIWYYPDGDSNESADFIAVYLELADHHHHHKKSDVAGDDVTTARFTFSLIDVSTGEPAPSTIASAIKLRTFCANTPSWGFRKFIKRDILEEYLKDDSFTIRCVITVVKIRSDTTPVKFHVTPSTDLPRHFGELLVSKVGADVRFKVGRETFMAHRNVLAARSPVFKAELFGWMKEKASSGGQIKIDDMEARVFEAMLHFIYTDTLPEIEEGERRAMAQHLLVAADRYGLERLKMVCEEVLCNYIDLSSVATTLALAEQHGCHGLKEGCFKLLKSPGNMKAVVASDGYDHLARSCPSVVKELLVNVFP